MFINGKCHCGNIALELEWEGDPPEIPVRACGCSFCVKHGGVWTSNPKSRLAVAIRDASLVSKYAFGSRTATFHVCSRCGTVPLVTSEIATHLYAVVNVNVLENVDQSWLRRATANFEGEDVESRLARRRRNWIADVRIAQESEPMTAAALLVIDIQRGAFDGARCPAIDRSTDLVNNARTLIDAARASGTPIVFIQHCDEPVQAFEEGTPHWEFHEELSPLPEDTVIRKYSSSAFENTDLAAKLEGLGTKDLVLCGLQSEFCVYNTAKSALELGYSVRVAKDGHSTWPSEGKSSTLISEEVNGQLRERGAVLESTTSLAASLRTRA